MRQWREIFLTVACGGMFLSWVHVWAAFIMPSLSSRPFSPGDGALILALAAMLTMLPQGRGWRIISIIGLHLLGFAFALLRVLYTQEDCSCSFWSITWIVDFLGRRQGVMEWIRTVLNTGWALTLWAGGIALGRKSPDPFTVSSRFDFGIAAFFLLLLLRLVMRAKGADSAHPGGSELSFCAFFVFVK